MSRSGADVVPHGATPPRPKVARGRFLNNHCVYFAFVSPILPAVIIVLALVGSIGALAIGVSSNLSPGNAKADFAPVPGGCAA